MKKIIITLFATVISASAVASNGSLDDFFKKNPDLQKNTAIRMAITTQAQGTAMTDGEMITTGEDYMKAVGGVKEKMQVNGYDYAVIATRDLKELCDNDMVDMYSLTPKDCEIIKQYKED